MATDVDHAALMDRVYRLQRRFGIYDVTRKYYLLGRDPMIRGLRPAPGSTALEIGCGTGRNLIKAARLYPDVNFHGVDISREMLAASASAVSRAGMATRIRLAWADAESFDPMSAFRQNGYDRVFISYAVSMIPRWETVMRDAVRFLAPGGELHVVDFGDMARLPRWSRHAMRTWLRWYHVTPRHDLIEVAGAIAADNGGEIEAVRLHRDFSWICVIRKP